MALAAVSNAPVEAREYFMCDACGSCIQECENEHGGPKRTVFFGGAPSGKATYYYEKRSEEAGEEANKKANKAVLLGKGETVPEGCKWGEMNVYDERPRVYSKCVLCDDRKPWPTNCVMRSYMKPRKEEPRSFAETNADVTLTVDDAILCPFCGICPAEGVFIDRMNNVDLERRYTCRACCGSWGNEMYDDREVTEEDLFGDD